MSVAEQPQTLPRPVVCAKPKPKPACSCGQCRSCNLRQAWARGEFGNRRAALQWNAWTDDERAVLRQYAGRVPLEEVAARCSAASGISRTVNAVEVEAAERGISMERRAFTIKDLSKLFGTDFRAVRYGWIEAGLLAPHAPLKRGCHAWFDNSEVERFVRECPWAYDVAGMDRSHPLTVLAITVNRRDPWLTAGAMARLVGMTAGGVRCLVRRVGIPHQRRYGRAGFGEIVIQESQLERIREVRAEQQDRRRELGRLSIERMRAKVQQA